MTISMIAIVAALTHLLAPDLRIDSITVALVVVAVFPWLGVLVSRVKWGDFEADFREWKEEVKAEVKKEISPGIERATQLAQNAERRAEKVDTAVEAVTGRFAEAEESLVERAPRFEPEDGTPLAVQLAALAESYNAVRDTEPPGVARTANMTKIANSMVRLTPQVLDLPWKSYLGSMDRGLRLAAYAYLFANPLAEAAIPLVRSVTEVEDKPFGQYWGLRALNKVLAQQVDTTTLLPLEPTLRTYLSSLPRGTDRYTEVQAALKLIQDAKGNAASRTNATLSFPRRPDTRGVGSTVVI